MTLRSIPDTIEALRVIFFRFEQALDPEYDLAALTELKRIILDRIGELESELAMTVRCERPSAAAFEAPEVAQGSAPSHKVAQEGGSTAD
jgi:hypothetical protein